jgi:hypothetical protein
MLKAIDVKITEQTKIKDLIPEGMSLKDCESTEWSIHIDFKPKEKTFEDYEKDYYRDRLPKEAEDLLMLNVDAEDLNIENRLGLLWYIVKDKGGTLEDLSDLLFRIAQPNEMSEPDISSRVWKLLPQSFIESFKEE